MTRPSTPERSVSRGLARLCALAVCAGIGIGFVGGAFRWCLNHANAWRGDLLDWAGDAAGPAWLVPVAVTAAGAAIGAFVVRLVPLASGSGVQQVEAVDRGLDDPPPLRVVPAKFVGGLVALGSGLTLGREGPTVHMGAAIGAWVGRLSRSSDDDVRILTTSLAGAGLGVAFNAPVGGGLFALEEVAKSYRMRLVLPTLLAVGVAVGCARILIGDDPDFAVSDVQAPSVVVLPIFIVFGLITGILGVFYNQVILTFFDGVRRLTSVPMEVKAVIIGGLVGGLLAFDPDTAGGGDALTQGLLDGARLALPTVAILLLVRFVVGPLSYAAGTPGGLFAPLLAVGALWGVLFAALVNVVVPAGYDDWTVALIIVGMSAFFAAVVRAPITGIVLVMELTAVTTVTIPMLAATAAAVLIANAVGSPPIYDSLRDRMLAGKSGPTARPGTAG
ncbi:ClC family H(+)/Cl(-) exchange transporter [Gordonia sp. HY442]|uniref:ClC family H(+)/Cl(-) exchange transporter n=1 Tax=Gordonia zhenghanii TaxID=2911516 RepID=UPI001F2BB5E9|nr:ClC family H(+)/Cl(-) exchange transporter [Gordonia zhenghanii]MCF8606575.1 ClC family H(+)/Cl(-) exchange transporter [Gordonia zhenghanii]